MISNYKSILIFLVFLLSNLPLYAVEVAPRISDREIITALTELKMGQKNINQRFDPMQKSSDRHLEQVSGDFEQVNQRFDQMQKTTDERFGQMNRRFDQVQKTVDDRFDQVNQRFDQMQKTVDDRFDQVNQRFDQVNQRFDQMQKTISENSAQMNKRLAFIENLMGIMITAILGLVGFVIWDRKTALRPLEKKLDKLEQDLQHDLELQSPEGSRMTRMIHAFRELAQQDPQVKRTLQSFSLL